MNKIQKRNRKRIEESKKHRFLKIKKLDLNTINILWNSRNKLFVEFNSNSQKNKGKVYVITSAEKQNT